MTRVAFVRRDGALCGFEARGHAGQGAYGRDIVCAALSSLLTTAVNALETVAGCKPVYSSREGRMTVLVPADAGHDAEMKAHIVLATVRQGVLDLASAYPKRVRTADRFETYTHTPSIVRRNPSC